jgi:hypothetical protein
MLRESLYKGYGIEMLPDLKKRPMLTFKHKDGRIVTLPADPYSLNYYLSKGLVLVPPPPDKPKKKRGRPRKLEKGGKREF